MGLDRLVVAIKYVRYLRLVGPKLERRWSKMKVSTRQIVVVGVLTALTIALGASGVGLIGVPTPAGAATTMHIPVIIGGILEGPLVGSFLGLLFGLFTMHLGPAIAVIPARLFIGVAAFYAYRATHFLIQRWLGQSAPVVAAAVAGIVGSVVNTVGVLTMATLIGLFTVEAAVSIALLHGVPEAILAAVVSAFLILPLSAVTKRNQV
ncbi:MAG TPA: ECF transporter S component [Firmicutes bacterium]|nr:ECF transporter S component [Bacillota bacterium]